MFDPFTALASLTGIALALWVTGAVVVIGTTVFWIVELIDAARREFPNPILKLVWLLVIFFTHVIGGLIYFVIGKSQGYLPGENPNSYTRRN